MMKNKRMLALLLALVLTLSALPTAWAAETTDPTATDPTVETTEPTQETAVPTEAVMDAPDAQSEGQRTEPEVSHVGRTGKVENGDMLYTKPDVASESYKVWGIFGLFSYPIAVEEHFVLDGTEWYRFSNNGILNETTKGKYPYVKAADVTLDVEPEETTEPTEESTEATSPSEPSAPTEGDGEFADSGVTFEGSTEKADVAVYASEDAFPEGTVMSVRETVVDESVAETAVANLEIESTDLEVLGMYAVDISFSLGSVEQQPSEPVTLRLELPSEDIPDNANMVTVVHMSANGAEVVGYQYLKTGADTQHVSVQVDGFSSYAAVYVNGKYNAQKMSSALSGNSRYSIVPFAVDLFNYDPVTINKSLNDVTDNGKGFLFVGYSEVTGVSSGSGINNSAATHAKQGILQNSLVNGLPVFNYLTGTNAGVNTGKVLFSDSEYPSSKTTYNDIPFEFVYDNQTGYYEYKSSANHAQLNSEGTKIELYADTLSTHNSYADTLDLSTAHDANDFTGPTAAVSSYKATARNNNPSSTDRLDPFVVFTVNKVAASAVGQIYVKAKVPEDIGANTFQLFFDTSEAPGMAEEKSFKKTYTASGDWIEFVIDTSECAKWTGTITNIRIDLFDENLDAPSDYLNLTSKSYPIEIAQISLINKNIDTTTTRGGFYPFSEVQDSYPGNNTAFDLTVWENLIQQSSIVTARASRSIFNDSPASNIDLYAELAYGMVMEFDFYLPVDRTGKDLTYYFNGDDDLWVFVDDQLVLDIGGGHGAVTGSVNFSTGARYVQNAAKVTGYNSGGDGTYAPVNDTISGELMSAGRHTMKIFYLERGGSVSNCYMKFNLPQTPEGDVVVQKTVNGVDASVLENETFTFKIETKYRGTGGDADSTVKAPYSYTINGTETSRKTDNDGCFTLKAGEYAIFEIPELYDVTITETEYSIKGFEHTSTTVNSKVDYSDTQRTTDGGQCTFNFVNTYDEIEVIYTYIAVNPTDDTLSDQMKGKVKLTGDAENTYTYTSVTETIGSRTGDPKGSTAQGTQAVKFVGWYSDPECTQVVTSNEANVNGAVIDPVKVNGLYTNDTFYAKFVYMYGDLKITKTGIDELDNHAANGDNKQEQQSTIYNISGTSNSGVAIDMDVVIVGNDSVTIEHLPVGNYTVMEKTDWSWRYELANVDQNQNPRTVTVEDSKETPTTFQNERKQQYWLSGDNYWKNFFNGETPNPAPTASPTT